MLLVSLAQADVSEKLAEKNVDKASDKSSDSKPKRDASFLAGGSSYHGPSYKYLPPSQIASVYDSYSSGHGGSFGSGSSGHGASFGSGSSGHRYHGHGFGHHAGLGGGVKFSGVSHGFGSAASYPSGGHYYAGNSGSGSHGYAGGVSGLGHVSSHGFAGGRGGQGASSGHSYVIGHGIGSSAAGHGSFGSSHSFGGSGLGHKVVTTSAAVPSYTLSAGHVGASAGAASGYHYAKGISGSLPAGGSGSSGFGGHGHSSHGFSGQGFSGQGFSDQGFSGQGFSGHEVHHSDHVHNGNQEHHYIVSTSQDSGVGVGVGAQSGSVDSGYHYESPAATYIPPAVPSTSYGVPLTSVGPSYTNKYNGGSSDDAPVYAAGHKGLGHFGFTANKPNVLHTSFVDSGFKTPTYTKIPFKPSTFLGAKFEGSSVGVDGHQPSQQYLPPSGVGADSNGYDYPVPSGAGLQYTETNYQGSNDGGALNAQQPEATYLPPHDISSSPNANYLPPTGNAYPH